MRVMMRLLTRMIFAFSIAWPVDIATSSISIWAILETIISTGVPNHVPTSSRAAKSVDRSLVSVSAETANQRFLGDFRTRSGNFGIAAKCAPARGAWVTGILSYPVEWLSILINHDANSVKQVSWSAILHPRIYSDQTLWINLWISKNCLSYNHIIP